ncbi:hypothetical protein DH09_01695 [Bacillaceae bacterium JMAK1]|nr:hypothetical protein DH09_01695 [Bacillaceae bacterium JMAK1]
MVHLVKLEDYVSRYEVDLQRYPNQYSRLKQEKWRHMKKLWQEANVDLRDEDDFNEEWFLGESKSFWKQSIAKFKKKPVEASLERQDLHPDFERYRNKTMADLEQQFYYELFQAQLKWASSSLQEESILDSRYRYDSRLRQLLKELPDNYFLFYYPVLKIAQAEIDLEVVVISPTDIYCVSFIETNKNSIIHASTDRFWKIDHGEKYRKKIVSPMLSQNRMRKVIATLLSEATIRSQIHSVIVAPDGYIDDYQAPLRALKVDCTSYNQWLGELKRHPSPLKKKQMDITVTLLNASSTKSFERHRSDVEKQSFES